MVWLRCAWRWQYLVHTLSNLRSRKVQDLPRQSEPPGHGPFDFRLAFWGAEACPWPEEAADDALAAADDALDSEGGWVFSSGCPRCRTEYGATASSDRYTRPGWTLGVLIAASMAARHFFAKIGPVDT